MFKIFFTFFLLVILIFSVSVVAGNKTQSEQVVTEEDEVIFDAKMKNVTSTLSYPKLASELGRTWYDYATNAVMGRMMAHAYGTSPDGIHFVFMKIATSTAERYVTYDYFNEDPPGFLVNASIVEGLRTGWGRCINGKNDELLGVRHGGGLTYFYDVAEIGYSFTEMAFGADPSTFPGIARNGDTIILVGDFDPADAAALNTLMYTTDYGVSWQTGDLPDFIDPQSTENANAEIWPEFNPANPGEWGFVNLEDNATVTNNRGGKLYWISTTDNGATWNSLLLADENTPNSDGSYYWFENFSQTCAFYGMDGTIHTVNNGFGEQYDGGGTNSDYIYPVIYRNTVDNQWIELTSVEKGRPADATLVTYLLSNRPGNGNGNSYPQLSEGPNGELVCIWQQWEDDGAGNIVVQTGIGGTEMYCTDIWGAYSPDAGQSWSAPFFVAGTPNQSDVYPNITRNFLINATDDSLILDISYMYDTNIGTSIFATPESDPSECIWNYDRVTLLKPIVDGIGDELDAVVEDFKLSQNYPNPFNPNTTIKFNVKKATNVTLDVLNVLGEKVATLINGKVKAGETVATFNGTDFSSGVYFYQLTAGDFVQTRKMLLVK